MKTAEAFAGSTKSSLLRRAGALLASLAASAAVMAVASPASAGAWVYQNCGYGGTAKYLPNGTYTMGQLNAMGVGNDWISSIAVDGGSRMQVFEHDNFSGNWEYFYGNRSCVVENPVTNGSGSWNDRVTSLKIEGYSGAGIIVDYTKYEYWNGSGWTLYWADHFNGSSLNTSNWQAHDSYHHGVYNNEQQCYVNEQGVNNNYWVSGGELKILAQKEVRNCGGWNHNYSSARLVTKGRREFANGAWEARVQLFKSDNANGVWPAFWLLGDNVAENPPPMGGACWPTYGARELDIWEYSTNPGAAGLGSWDSFITNFIQGSSCGGAAMNRYDVGGINPYSYHTYRLEFWGGNVKIFVDGQFKRQLNDDPWENQEYFAILNVALGGSLGGPTFGW